MRQFIFITRPESSAKKTAEILIEKGYDVFCEPFLQVVYDTPSLPDLDDYAALVFTSMNGVRAFTDLTDRRDMLCYAVGNQTSTALKKAGFNDVVSAQGKVADLIQLIAGANISGKMLYVRGSDIAYPLDVPQQEIDEIIVYHTEKTQEISDACLKHLKKGVFSHILFYSTRTAENFVDLAKKYGVEGGLNQCEALCLGDSMVECLTYLQWKQIKIAKAPEQSALLQLLEK